MFFGVSHIIVPVTDLERSVRIWRDVIGFAEARRGDEYVDMDSGNVSIRLIKVPTVESNISLRLSVKDVEATYQNLLAGGASSRYAQCTHRIWKTWPVLPTRMVTPLYSGVP